VRWFSKFFFFFSARAAPPLSLIYLLCGPLPFIDTVTYGEKLYFHIVDICVLKYIYITVLYSVLFLNILFTVTYEKTFSHC